jgi:hypothetical protein
MARPGAPAAGREGGRVAGELTRSLLGTRSKLFGVVGTLVLLAVVVPVVLVVLDFVVPAVVSFAVGAVGLALVVMALLPGRRRWR